VTGQISGLEFLIYLFVLYLFSVLENKWVKDNSGAKINDPNAITAECC